MKASHVGIHTYPFTSAHPTRMCRRCGIERAVNTRQVAEMCRDCRVVERDIERMGKAS